MRLRPRNRLTLPPPKVYRAFPELDQFSIDECNAFYVQARSCFIGRRRIRLVLAFVLGYGVIYGAMAAGIYFLVEPLPIRPRFDRVADLYAFLVIGGLSTVLAVATWSVTRAIVRATIRNRLSHPECSTCGYSLSGLPAPSGGVRCPECGSSEMIQPTRTPA
ncbi:MAG: hypothetical protein ACKVU4_06235 [Phycisphaerales bacterium]